MEENKVVKEEEPTTPEISEDLKTQGQAEVIEEPTPTPKASGDKTPPNLLLKSLQEERAKVKKLTEELEEKSSALSETEVFSDEGKLLQKQIKGLEETITTLKSDSVKRELQSSNQIFKDKWEEFEEFRTEEENKGMNLKTAAKAFLVEQGMYEPKRKGLEKPTGGPRTPLASGMTADDVKLLRETNFKKYQELLLAGKLKING